MNPPENLLSVDYRLLMDVLLGLLSVSILYAALLSYVEREWNFVSDYTWITVIVGVGYTLAGVAIVDLGAAILAWMAFSVSSIPIIVRSLAIDSSHRKELRAHLEQVGDDSSETVA